MEINWQQVPSDTIIGTTRSAIGFIEPVAESETVAGSDDTVRLYVVFMNLDSKTLEQQVEALSEAVELRVKLYDRTGHAAVIQTTEKYVTVIQNTPEVIRVKRETAAEQTGSMDMGSDVFVSDITDHATDDTVIADADHPADDSVEAEAADISTAESDDHSEDVVADEIAQSDTEHMADEDAAQSVQVAEDAGEDDAQSIDFEENEQITQTSQTVVTPAPVKKDGEGSTLVFGILGCIIIAVVIVLIMRRK